MPDNLVEDAEAFVEIDEVGAAFEEDVLTVIDCFAGLGVIETGSAPAEAVFGFDEGNVEVCIMKTDRGGETGQPSAED